MTRIHGAFNSLIVASKILILLAGGNCIEYLKNRNNIKIWLLSP